ncbi:uncharacterized protein LOC133779487 [Humulus lupulus]|uniref:uncharacterized protein LOC133779487 n=1 Tax=Humulus lupulus TaxID=3486 RepID=UPI002B408888|nr:uncharacterized protein LOC133779487 [Humulus lupulus]
MSSEDMFELYSVPAAPSSKKKESRPHRGESSKNPPMKKAQTGDPPAAVPSKETTPPPSPLDQTSPPAPVDQNPPPPAPADQTPPDQTGDVLTNYVISSAKERMTKLSRHRCSREAIISTESMEGMLTMTASWHRSGALITELKASEAKHAEESKMTLKKNAELLEQNTKLAEELKTFQVALTKDTVEKEKYEEASLLNFKEATKLQDDLVASKKETEGLEGRIKELEETNASNLERYKGATSNCFYAFWKHNREADFSYLSERMRRTKIKRCLALLEEEERAKVPASPEISLATGIDGVEEEVGAFVDQQTPQDPPVPS